jgi:hypothetical protein
MGDVKLHYGNRLRLDVRYPGKPPRGLPEPAPEIPVHHMNAQLFITCRKPGGAMRLKTSVPGNVTCPKCLKLLNLPAHPKQPPCESPAGATGLAVDPAICSAKKPISTTFDSSFGSPPSASCTDAGFL